MRYTVTIEHTDAPWWSMSWSGEARDQAGKFIALDHGCTRSGMMFALRRQIRRHEKTHKIGTEVMHLDTTKPGRRVRGGHASSDRAVDLTSIKVPSGPAPGAKAQAQGGWIAPRTGGYTPKPSGQPKGLPPTGPGSSSRPTEAK